MTKIISIDGHKTGPDCPVFIIAEIGVNHNGDLDLAEQMIRKAAECGADCVKFQTFKAKDVVTKKAPKAQYQLKTTPSGLGNMVEPSICEPYAKGNQFPVVSS